MSVSELPRSGPAGARRPASSRRTTAARRLPEQVGPAEVIALPLPRRAPVAPTRAPRRWPAYVLLGGGVLLLPWLVLLALTLSSQTLAWVGLDAMESVGLIATGLLVLRRHPLRTAAAAMTATLLLVDAWFDTTTSTGSDLAFAVVLAVVAELPLAALCATVAVRAARTPAPPSPPPTCPTASAAARRKR
ncbi:hypothetical protein V2S66_20750 [Streptomyces sp. V4-01]|uniref:Uncharacterized protein n=1 Tax=Actinacidiphila polyblastidii TaxID=3110430 RepID=A0ABU7PF05_9ACTN|nr:hypothetical protein [Streptomyces sp. V4-01]